MKKMFVVLLAGIALLAAGFRLDWKGMDVHAEGGGAIDCALKNGNVNGDAHLDISDAVYLLSFLYLGGERPNPETVAPADCLTQAEADLAACRAELAQAKTDLAACQSDLTQSQADLTACRAELTKAKNDLAACQSDLNQAQTDLGMCQSDLNQAQTDLGMCQSDLTQAQSNLATCGSELDACNRRGLPATGQTTCYDEPGNVIPCDSAQYPGQDGFYQSGCPTSGRFVDHGDGTVTDTCTGLMWQKNTAVGTFNWQGALGYCEGLGLAGHNDWRLPNLRELRTLHDYSGGVPAIDPVFQAAADQYWTSTTFNADFTHAWSVGFQGDEGNSHEAKQDPFYVRAVRNTP